MNKKSTLLLVFTCFIYVIFPSQKVVAQESILGEVSSLYLEKLVATAKANYPRVRSLSSEVNMAKSDLSAAKISWLDPFSFQYVTRSNNANVNSVDLTTADLLTGYQVGVNFNPGILFAKPAVIKRAKEQIKMAQANADEYLVQLEALVRTRYFLYLQYQKSLVPVNNAYLDAESNVKAIKVKYQRGEASFLDYNSASITFNENFQTKLQTEANYLNAKVALEELTVVKLEYIK